MAYVEADHYDASSNPLRILLSMVTFGLVGTDAYAVRKTAKKQSAVAVQAVDNEPAVLETKVQKRAIPTESSSPSQDIGQTVGQTTTPYQAKTQGNEPPTYSKIIKDYVRLHGGVSPLASNNSAKDSLVHKQSGKHEIPFGRYAAAFARAEAGSKPHQPPILREAA